MNNEEKILAILENMQSDISGLKSDVSDLKGDVSDLKTGQAKLETRLDSVETELQSVSNTVVRMEQGQGQKLDALFDGYQQLDGKVSRIEEHVSSQDDLILKRVFPKAME